MKKITALFATIITFVSLFISTAFAAEPLTNFVDQNGNTVACCDATEETIFYDEDGHLVGLCKEKVLLTDGEGNIIYNDDGSPVFKTIMPGQRASWFDNEPTFILEGVSTSYEIHDWHLYKRQTAEYTIDGNRGWETLVSKVF